MKKLLFPVLATIIILACSNHDDMPCLLCGDNQQSIRSSSISSSSQTVARLSSSVNNGGGYFKYYDPDDEEERCQNGVVQGKCGDAWYNKETFFCLNSSSSTVMEICWDNTLLNNLSNISGYGFIVLSAINNQSIDYQSPRCQDGHLEVKCGGVWYNYKTHICQDNKIKTLKEYYESIGDISCGNAWYDPTTTTDMRCQNGTVEYKCGNVWYNISKYSCDDYTNSIVSANLLYSEECGSGNYLWFNPLVSNSRCKDGIVEWKCGDVWYNTNTHTCKDNIVKARTRCI